MAAEFRRLPVAIFGMSEAFAIRNFAVIGGIASHVLRSLPFEARAKVDHITLGVNAFGDIVTGHCTSVAQSCSEIIPNPWVAVLVDAPCEPETISRFSQPSLLEQTPTKGRRRDVEHAQHRADQLPRCGCRAGLTRQAASILRRQLTCEWGAVPDEGKIASEHAPLALDQKDRERPNGRKVFQMPIWINDAALLIFVSEAR